MVEPSDRVKFRPLVDSTTADPDPTTDMLFSLADFSTVDIIPTAAETAMIMARKATTGKAIPDFISND
jgi:hypothetical protein